MFLNSKSPSELILIKFTSEVVVCLLRKISALGRERLARAS